MLINKKEKWLVALWLLLVLIWLYVSLSPIGGVNLSTAGSFFGFMFLNLSLWISYLSLSLVFVVQHPFVKIVMMLAVIYFYVATAGPLLFIFLKI